MTVAAIERIAAAILLAVVVVRFRRIRRDSRSRPAWAAELTGAAACLADGSVVPLYDLDRVLGGTNVINLVRNMLVLAAFWFLKEAALRAAGRPSRPRRLVTLATFIALSSASFACITGRGPTSIHFIPQRIEQTPMMLYAGIYMLGVAYFAAEALIRCNPRGWPFVGVNIGAVLMMLACVSELAYLTSAHFDFWSAATHTVLYALFYPLFYGGAVVMSVSLVLFPMFALVRNRQLGWSILAAVLRRTCRRYDIAEDRPLGQDHMGHVYAMIIGIRDAQDTRRLRLRKRDFVALHRSEMKFDRINPFPS